MDPIKQLAKTRSNELNQPEALWLVAIGKAGSLMKKNAISLDEIKRLTSASHSPNQLRIILDYLGKQTGDATELFERVDGSTYSIMDWLEAIECFHDWISSHGQSTSLKTLLGYIECCTEATPNEPSLKNTVTEMLRQYGFEGE
ncbi:MAG: hypothetical protein O3C43_16355 [Verrucomicrobia bacterium]|nr:hypothetical protein [Verrucomicrobiota bacterium]MDA1068063.1 hypothetical protein [Verrucomicrobiota bacterium]